jgi:hypothetical protein
MAILQIAVGSALLLLGRRLFWVFVGSVGFAAGWMLATGYLGGQSQMGALILALACGFLGAILAFFLQRIAVTAAGFLAGIYLISHFLPMIEQATGWVPWIILLAGGILTAILVLLLFDWALIILSSLLGAAFLILETTHLAPGVSIILFLLLFVAGVAIQTRALHRRQARSSA